MADDLDAPLGLGKKPRRQWKLPVTIPQVIAGLLGLTLVVFGGWATFADNPLGGEPVAIVAANTPASSTPAPIVASSPAKPTDAAPSSPRRYDGDDGSQRTVTIIDGSTGKRQQVVISPNGATSASEGATPEAAASAPSAPASAAVSPAMAAAAVQSGASAGDPRLLEHSRHGEIPRVSPDGARPSEVYATLAKAAPNKPDAPRVAIIVGGLGIGTAVTDDAIAKLPPSVTLAFLPYGRDVAQQVTRARGHELLLQVAMEPFDYPDNDPGPQTLLTSLNSAQNIDRLQWQMSRFQSYVGLTNYMGARFVASETALGPILKDAGKRGLIYVDDGATTRSIAGQLAGAASLPFARADVQLDAVPSTADVDRALGRLESIARQRGNAIGWAHALPLSIERIARWAKAAESRGIQIVPITVLVVNKGKST